MSKVKRKTITTKNADRVCELIVEHRRARRLELAAKRKMDALHEQHPEYADSRPLISTELNLAGRLKAVQLRCPHDLTEHIATSDSVRTWRSLGLDTQTEDARPNHNRKRRQLGIAKAESTFYLKRQLSNRIFNQLTMQIPRSVEAAAALAKYVYRILENDLMAPSRCKSTREYNEACHRSVSALHPMMAVVRRFTKMRKDEFAPRQVELPRHRLAA